MEWPDTVSAFDAASARYDEIEHEPAFKHLREASMRLLGSTFRQGKIVLDIGCGTGTEAVWLAKRGITVVGIDPSEGMVAQAKKKAKAAGLSNVSLFCLPARDIAKLPGLCGFHRFDGAYSSLGSLNCEPVLEHVGEDLAGLLHPGSPVVISLFNKQCLAEMAASIFTRPSRMSRRSSTFLTMPVGGKPVTMRLYSLNELKKSFQGFHVTSCRALGFLAPPPYLGRRMPEDILEALARADRLLAGLWPASRLGDYMAVSMVRRV